MVMIRPSGARFLLERDPQPLVLTLPMPEVDPFELYQRIATTHHPSFLLESGQGPEQTARYSFLGSDPYLLISGKGQHYTLQTTEGTDVRAGNPFQALADIMRRSRRPRPEGLPPFFGGGVGYFSYDLVRNFESLPATAVDDLGLPDLCFAFVDMLTALDHQTKVMHLIFSPPAERLWGEPREKLYREGCDRLAALEARLSVPAKGDATISMNLPVSITPNMLQGQYMDKVSTCLRYIQSGDIYQANISQRFTIDWGLHSEHDTGTPNVVQRRLAHSLYGRLRRVNPSPFSALLDFGELAMVSASPERLVRVLGRQVATRPMAGTRPRGQSATEDRHLVEQLVTNSKERAEHLMLVDLERNDLGRVCRYGSVSVDELMVVERYSHVSHIVSNVVGTLLDPYDGFDVIPAVFPGGTITGVPKVRCMEIVDELEPVRRGPYTGSLGYLSWSGDMDLNILIRTLVLANDCGFLQVGAGIVADSDPQREYEETLLKAEAIFQTLNTNLEI